MAYRTAIFLSVVGVAVVSLTAAAFATDPSGLTSTTPIHGLLGQVDVKHNDIELEAEGDASADVAVATLTFKPGASSGWHHHPGVVVVVVESGTITFYDEHCNSEVHEAGDAFVEASDDPGLAKNAGTVDAVVHATYIVPTSESPSQPTPLRIDDPQPKHCDAT